MHICKINPTQSLLTLVEPWRIEGDGRLGRQL